MAERSYADTRTELGDKAYRLTKLVDEEFTRLSPDLTNEARADIGGAIEGCKGGQPGEQVEWFADIEHWGVSRDSRLWKLMLALRDTVDGVEVDTSEFNV